MESSSSSSHNNSDAVLRGLISRGWRLRDTRSIIQPFISPGNTTTTVDSVESELLNMDLRSIGAPSLLSIKTSSPIQLPIILQVCSSRDISRSSITDPSGNSGNQRLLRLKLTDGHSEVTAVEYSRVPSIPDDVVPGTKVLLQNKVDVRSGILCLKNNTITILGGIVQSLYDEWQMKRKYMDVSRLTLSKENASDCPPPFEKLQIRTAAQGTASVVHTSATKRTNSSSDTKGVSTASSSNVYGQSLVGKGECSNLGQTSRIQNDDAIVNNNTGDAKVPQNEGQNQEKPTCSLTRPKVTASAPVQNQVAAQKLLQKTSQPKYDNRNSRNQRHRGKAREEEESSVITLDEWEKRKAGINISTRHEQSHLSQDEVLARQLQQQFDLEDNHVQEGPHVMEATDIKMSMFSYERDDVEFGGRTEYRGRGRGRRGRGRGRGRGRRF